MQRQTWLDGLRGIASIIVATNHIIMGQFSLPYRSYWSAPAQENRRLVQLLPFRLLFTPTAMVTVFLVMSGYSISIAIATVRFQGDMPTFYAKLTSATFRRAMRLFIPVVIVTVIAHVLWYLDLYNWAFPESSKCTQIAPWTKPWQHVKCTVSDVADLINIIRPFYPSGLNDHLVTLKWELRGSVLVYLAFLATATTKTTMRFGIYGCWMAFVLWYGYSDLFAFLAGLCLAEIDAREFVRRVRPTLPDVKSWQTTYESTSTTPRSPISWASISLKWIILTVGLYLICTPYGEGTPVDYGFQYPPYSPHWDGWTIRVAVWQTYGAVAIIYALRDLEVLKTWLNSRPVQFLGKISFSLYLTHMTVIRILRTPLLNLFAQVLVGHPYRGDMWEPSVASYTYTVWTLTGVVVTVVSLVVATHMSDFVDQKPIQWARQVEDFCRSES